MTVGPSTVPKGSLVDHAMGRVRAYIRANSLKVGDSLPGEGHFAKELGVSRAVMREAFGALAALRQIDVANGRRAKVCAIDGSVMANSLEHAVATHQATVADVWEVRRTLELRTVVLAAERRTDVQAEQLLDLSRQMREHADNQPRLMACDIAFHRMIAQASGNPLFYQIVRSFEPLMETAVPKAWETRRTKEEREYILDMHAALARAIANGNSDAAAGAMAAHFDDTIGALMRHAITQ